MRTVAAAIVLAGALASPRAFAGDTPLSLYVTGHFARAEAAGVAQNDAQGLAIAARAALADDMMRDQPCLDCLKRAEDLSRRAIAADPKQPEGHIYLAAAIGYEARIIGDLAAQSKGYANEAKSELDAALSSDPKNVWALAALGSWNIQVVRSAGPTLARWLFGANFDTGRQLYAQALAIDPNNVVLHYQYALALASFDVTTYRDTVLAELDRAVADTPTSAFETFSKARAVELRDAVRRGDLDDIQRLVKRDQGYPA